jgi:hypothetical protein
MACEEWPLIWPCDPPTAETTTAKVEAAVAAARELLWSRTGRRLGVCSIVESYEVPGTSVCAVPYLGDDRLWHLGRPGAGRFIVLSQQPVHSVQSVSIDGAVVDPSSYRLAGSRLYRVGADWPAQVAAEDAPRVVVAYSYGVSLAEGSRWHTLAGLALGEVAMEVFRLMCGEACKLPSRAVSVTRQGVTVQLADPQQFVDQQLLGLPLADQLILATNPTRLRARSRVYSPDMARSAVTAAP